MKKFLPYQQYDLLAIENWLNVQARRGYRLVKMDGVFPEFKKHYDKLVCYRVRYIPNNTRTDHAFYWGDLYIYQAEDPTALPKPSYEKGSVMAARNRKKPWFALALLICVVYLAWTLAGSLSTAAPVFIGFAALSVAAQLVWLVSIALDWRRGHKIAEGTLNSVENPPSPMAKTVLTVSSITAILATFVAVLLSEGLI